MWPRVDGLRALELGTPGELRAWLNGLVLDDAGARIATVEVTGVERTRFADVP